MDKRCAMHSSDSQSKGGCCVSGRVHEQGPQGADEGVSLLVSGSPCNPFSTKRAKRFSNGSVSAHSMTATTMQSVIDSYVKFEPRAGITEQVKGFGMRYSPEDPTTPLAEFLILVV